MTAIVGTINRRGVAFAADSAATHTISSKHKITNHANKIFELSKYHPVGVALCGNLDFLGLPWEDIIKLFRSKMKRKGYKTLKEYSDAFFIFVRTNIMSGLKNDQKRNLEVIVNGFLNEIVNLSRNDLEEKKLEVKDETMFPMFIERLDYFEDMYKGKETNRDFSSYTLDKFKVYSDEIVSRLLSPLTTNPLCPIEFKEKFVQSLYYIIISQIHVYLVNTELIFWGYGDDEIFPSYYSYVISSAFDDRIKITLKSQYAVSNDRIACVEPFAQTDVANTVVRGIDADLRMKFYESYNASITMFRDEIVSKLELAGAPMKLKEVLTSLDMNLYTNTFVDGMEAYIQDNYIQKLVDTVAYLSKEDLADMAESLVRMTYLKRRITSEEESVGGPVDVAVITKGDGFIWLKCKHYFEAELNPHFFNVLK
ncbi:MAG: hypothetical protein J6M30_08500 [Bacteroidales bacterium]|nr:hypothetical protein [Bacteroidales bacterium]